MLLLAMVLIAVGCDSHRREKQEIKTVATGYLEAMGNYRIDEAVPYSSRGTCETTIKIFSRLMELTDTAYILANTPAEITITGVNIKDDSTACVHFHKHTPITEQYDSVTVILEDGQWRVDVQIKAPPFLKMEDGDNIVQLPLEEGK